MNFAPKGEKRREKFCSQKFPQRSTVVHQDSTKQKNHDFLVIGGRREREFEKMSALEEKDLEIFWDIFYEE